MERALQRETANAPLSASLSNSPTYRTRLLIYNRKGILNLVESGENITMRGKELTYKNFVGKGLLLGDISLPTLVPPAGFTWTIKSPKILCVGLLFVFMNLSW